MLSEVFAHFIALRQAFEDAEKPESGIDSKLEAANFKWMG